MNKRYTALAVAVVTIAASGRVVLADEPSTLKSRKLEAAAKVARLEREIAFVWQTYENEKQEARARAAERVEEIRARANVVMDPIHDELDALYERERVAEGTLNEDLKKARNTEEYNRILDEIYKRREPTKAQKALLIAKMRKAWTPFREELDAEYKAHESAQFRCVERLTESLKPLEAELEVAEKELSKLQAEQPGNSA